MTKTLKERIDENKLAASRAAFSGYVQSVAFNMTLSRNMVDGMAAIRDFGCVSKGKESNSHLGSHFVPVFRALERRGLAWHDYIDHAPKEHAYYKLTRAGELMCELLVEANLIPEMLEAKKKKA